MVEERLSKFVARAGVASRRKADEIIQSGRVKVNGSTVIDPAQSVDATVDHITLDNVPIKLPTKAYYVALYKPVGYLSDLSDPRRRKIARDLIRIQAPLFPVGRLDYNSEGLMLFTNDGDFANRITHPRNEVEKEYLVKLTGMLTEADLTLVTRGLKIDGQIFKVRSIRFIKGTAKNAWYDIVVTEGKNRMIRRIAQAISHPVLKLKRIRIGTVTLGELKPGEYRVLDRNSVKRYVS